MTSINERRTVSLEVDEVLSVNISIQQGLPGNKSVQLTYFNYFTFFLLIAQHFFAKKQGRSKGRGAALFLQKFFCRFWQKKRLIFRLFCRKYSGFPKNEQQQRARMEADFQPFFLKTAPNYYSVILTF